MRIGKALPEFKSIIAVRACHHHLHSQSSSELLSSTLSLSQHQQNLHLHNRTYTNTMPPKGRQLQRPGYARTVLNELSSPDNRTVVTAVTFFAVCLVASNSASSAIFLVSNTDIYIPRPAWHSFTAAGARFCCLRKLSSSTTCARTRKLIMPSVSKRNRATPRTRTKEDICAARGDGERHAAIVGYGRTRTGCGRSMTSARSADTIVYNKSAVCA